jgi:hypothetical protein
MSGGRSRPPAGPVRPRAGHRHGHGGPQVLVQVGDRLRQAGVMGGQHRPASGRVAQAVEDRDTLGRPQHYVEGRHRALAVGTAQQLPPSSGPGPRTWPGTRPAMLRLPARGWWRRCRTTCRCLPPVLARANAPWCIALFGDFGSSVERTAKLHPLWRGACVPIRRQTQYVRGGHGVSPLDVSGVVACGGMWRLPGGGSVRS